MNIKKVAVLISSILIFFSFFGHPAYAIDANVSGVVTGEGTSPLKYASMKVIDEKTQEVKASAETDAQGQYSFDVPVGSYTIEIEGDVLRKVIKNQKIASNTMQNFALGDVPKMDVVPKKNNSFGFNSLTYILLIELAAVVGALGLLYFRRKKKKKK